MLFCKFASFCPFWGPLFGILLFFSPCVAAGCHPAAKWQRACPIIWVFWCWAIGVGFALRFGLCRIVLHWRNRRCQRSVGFYRVGLFGLFCFFGLLFIFEEV